MWRGLYRRLAAYESRVTTRQDGRWRVQEILARRDRETHRETPQGSEEPCENPARTPALQQVIYRILRNIKIK